MRRKTLCLWGASLAIAGVAGCVGAASTDAVESPVIYGTDDRQEAFTVSNERTRALVQGSMVALVPRSLARFDDGVFAAQAQSLGAKQNLCPGEAFASQPSAAFCSGVLVDWDLVLTAGHCARAMALEDFVVVRGFYYDAPDHLAIASDEDVREVAAVVDDALDPADVDPRLDFAWLRLKTAVRPPWQPAPVNVKPTAAVGDPITSIGTEGGVPLKVNGDVQLRDLRAGTLDYFVADSDTCHGGSGGGAFDASGRLLGILARGSTDYFPTTDGCSVESRIPDGNAADEQFTYASAAVQSLCRADPTASALCRANCDGTCAVAEPAPQGGCVFALSRPRWPALAAALASLIAAMTRRRAPRSCPQSAAQRSTTKT